MRNITFTSVLLLALLAGTPAAAEPIVMNFDDQVPGTGVTGFFEDGRGVSFFAGLVERSPFATSPPNVVTGSLFGGVFFGERRPGAEVDRLGKLWTDLVAFNIVGTTPGESVWVAEVFGDDPAGGRLLLDSITGTSDQRVVFSREGPDVDFFTVSLNGAAVDDFTFNPPVVPEPATLTLVGTGLAATVVAHRRRKRRMKSSLK